MAPVRGLKSYVKLGLGLFCGYIVWGWLFGSSVCFGRREVLEAA